MMNKWEIWLAKVAFEDQPEVVKNRPVLILNKNEAYILSLKITKHIPRNSNEYRIVKWREAGLDVESTIRIGKRLKLKETDFIHKIGTLQAIDIVEVVKRMKKGR